MEVLRAWPGLVDMPVKFAGDEMTAMHIAVKLENISVAKELVGRFSSDTQVCVRLLPACGLPCRM